MSDTEKPKDAESTQTEDESEATQTEADEGGSEQAEQADPATSESEGSAGGGADDGDAGSDDEPTQPTTAVSDTESSTTESTSPAPKDEEHDEPHVPDIDLDAPAEIDDNQNGGFFLFGAGVTVLVGVITIGAATFGPKQGAMVLENKAVPVTGMAVTDGAAVQAPAAATPPAAASDEPFEVSVESGKELFNSTTYVCNTCHSIDGSKLVGPSLKNKYGTEEKLADGSTVTIDDAYIKESILQPNAKVVEGFAPAMPPYQGRLSDEQIEALTLYIADLAGKAPQAGGGEGEDAEGTEEQTQGG